MLSEEKIVAGLNLAQKEAVETLSGPLLILAGAGSGKTKTLTHRIANLILHGVNHERILAVTFTNKAAKEMRERLANLMEKEHAAKSFMPFMGTFHGICVKLLRIEYKAAGISRNFLIYDTDDQIALIKQEIKKIENFPKNIKPRAILSTISQAKTDGISESEYKEQADYPYQKNVAKIYSLYEKRKEEISALDFDDLLLYTVRILENFPEIRKKWQNYFSHILIDEYQDTNHLQYLMVKYLTNENQNVCAVGDDWQSIYSWRGADFTNILNFERDFKNAKVIKLEENYRSTKNILEVSQKIINHNKTRSEKTLFTSQDLGSPVVFERLLDETDEARWVVRQISKLATLPPYSSLNPRPFSDFAILYRTNAQSSAFESVLVANKIPYKIIGGLRFYDRKEIKDVVAILKLASNPKDLVSLERVVKNILSGIGEISLMKIFNYLKEPEKRLGDYELLETIPKKAGGAIAKLVNFMTMANSQNYTLAELVEMAISYFGIIENLKNNSENSDERIENLGTLVNNAVGYQSLDDFLADISLTSSSDDSTVKDFVSLMTIHASKGLEFPVVFLVGLNEGLFPNNKVEDELEEERRLAYVGMTRARENLMLTCADSRLVFGMRNYCPPSRFITEAGYDPDARDLNGDGIVDYDFGNLFGESGIDPFPPDEEIFY